MKTYLITLHNDARGAWRFRFQSPALSWWKVQIIKVVGWTIQEIA